MNATSPSPVTVETLTPVAYQGVSVITTDLLAAVYETEAHHILQNYSRNTTRFVEGKHFYKVSGGELTALRLQPSFSGLQISPKTRHLMLWTERGARPDDRRADAMTRSAEERLGDQGGHPGQNRGDTSQNRTHHPFEDGDIGSDRGQLGLEGRFGDEFLADSLGERFNDRLGLRLRETGIPQTVSEFQGVEGHGGHLGNSSAAINIGGLTGHVKGGMVADGGVTTFEDSKSGRHPVRTVAFFMPGDRPAHVPLWREGEEYNTRKGNNSARSLSLASLRVVNLPPPARS